MKRVSRIHRAALAAFICMATLSCKEERELPEGKKELPSGVMADGPMALQSAHKVHVPKAGTESKQIKKDNGCRPEMARIENFCIDRWEVHLVDRGTKKKHAENKSPTKSIDSLAAVSAPDVYPQGHMSQITARKACSNAGKRLCTRDEWQRACMGPEKRKYPYGSQRKEGTCNVDKRNPHILDKMFPDIPHKRRLGREFNHPDLLLEPGYLSLTGEYEGCVTREKVFDMDGNLSEWVEETNGDKGVFMGDPFSGSGKSGCGRIVGVHLQKYLDYSIGTRCCSNTARGTSQAPRE
jgi:hypothetical protein